MSPWRMRVALTLAWLWGLAFRGAPEIAYARVVYKLSQWVIRTAKVRVE